ncbi:MAG: hypothetical protein IJX26_01530 [Clostridia bacterium]|nr:hypothetical protein [Clostridia bacterium]
MKERTKKNNNWLKLDNAALIYPSSSSENWNSVFRLSAYLKAEVNPEILQQAVNVVIERFPNFDVTLRRGMFWYYLQGMNTFPKVEQEVNYPCRRMEINRKKHLFRVLYYKNKISFESFHCLTDGYGAMCFLNSLLACYFYLGGEKISTEQLLADYNDKCSPEEMEDSFKTFTDDSGCSKRSTKKAYQIHGTPQQNGVLDVVTAVLDLEKTKQVAKEKGCTITQLLTAVYAKSIINYQKHMLVRKKPVIISLPVNLRKIFDTKTLRIFSSWVDFAFEGKDKN